jgi:RNA polymerase sigma-70 factor (ECF subfamily)
MNLPTRASLLLRLKDLDDHRSWGDFYDTYWKLIHAVATKSGLTESEADDVVQETMIAAAKKMPEFQYTAGKDSFKGWLLQLTRWKVADQFRKRPPMKLPSGVRKTDVMARVPDPAGGVLDDLWEEEWQENLLKAAMKRVKRQVPSQHHEVFVLYVIKELPPEKVAVSCGIEVADVYRIKHRISALLKKEIERIETKLM